MSSSPEQQRIPLEEFARRYRGESVPLGNTFSYFSAAVSVSDDEKKEYLDEPIAALPPALAAELPQILVLLVPYLERVNGKGGATDPGLVSMEAPAESRRLVAARISRPEGEVLAFGIRDQEMADYHYFFYNAIAYVAAGRLREDAENQYFSLLRDELRANAHGEVDESSWRLKQALVRRTKGLRQSKSFRLYARQSFVDTMTLYLHGICCDIDVDTGPRQLASRYLRKRLQLLGTLFPPPEGYAIFPEELPAQA